ncbi:hypothetical protein H2248_003131 [Termitomyces sp. 'cryptogamus']|nr:hypothetical protein H2248_003131 [Termitomyces sp. 'cryptogamus']
MKYKRLETISAVDNKKTGNLKRPLPAPPSRLNRASSPVNNLLLPTLEVVEEYQFRRPLPMPPATSLPKTPIAPLRITTSPRSLTSSVAVSTPQHLVHGIETPLSPTPLPPQSLKRRVLAPVISASPRRTQSPANIDPPPWYLSAGYEPSKSLIPPLEMSRSRSFHSQDLHSNSVSSLRSSHHEGPVNHEQTTSTNTLGCQFLSSPDSDWIVVPPINRNDQPIARRDTAIYPLSTPLDDLRMKALLDIASSSTAFDSRERYPPPKCGPRTCQAILKQIKEWINREYTKPVLWVYGPAGVGKSAIAQTIAEDCAREKLLAASFFFSCDRPEGNSIDKLFITVAYQLAVSIPRMRAPILTAFSNDPSLVNRAVSTQVEALLITPFQSIEVTERSFPSLVIVDGIDECADPNTNKSEILYQVQRLVSNRNVPLRFLILSRPDHLIRASFEKSFLSRFSAKSIELSGGDSQSIEDVRCYLEHEFDRIRSSPEHEVWMSNIYTPWPTQPDLETLVERSAGYFIYATTLVNFIDQPDFSPVERLNIFLHERSSRYNPFEALDKLYYHILSRIRDIPANPLRIKVFPLNHWCRRFWQQCKNIDSESSAVSSSGRPRSTVLKEILRAVSAGIPDDAITDVFGIDPGQVSLTFRGLQSLMISQYLGRGYGHRPTHPFFYDFLYDPSRSGKYHIRPPIKSEHRQASQPSISTQYTTPDIAFLYAIHQSNTLHETLADAGYTGSYSLHSGFNPETIESQEPEQEIYIVLDSEISDQLRASLEDIARPFTGIVITPSDNLAQEAGIDAFDPGLHSGLAGINHRHLLQHGPRNGGYSWKGDGVYHMDYPGGSHQSNDGSGGRDGNGGDRNRNEDHISNRKRRTDGSSDKDEGGDHDDGDERRENMDGDSSYGSIRIPFSSIISSIDGGERFDITCRIRAVAHKCDPKVWPGPSLAVDVQRLHINSKPNRYTLSQCQVNISTSSCRTNIIDWSPGIIHAEDDSTYRKETGSTLLSRSVNRTLPFDDEIGLIKGTKRTQQPWVISSRRPDRVYGMTKDSESMLWKYTRNLSGGFRPVTTEDFETRPMLILGLDDASPLTLPKIEVEVLSFWSFEKRFLTKFRANNLPLPANLNFLHRASMTVDLETFEGSTSAVMEGDVLDRIPVLSIEGTSEEFDAHQPGLSKNSQTSNIEIMIKQAVEGRVNRLRPEGSNMLSPTFRPSTTLATEYPTLFPSSSGSAFSTESEVVAPPKREGKLKHVMSRYLSKIGVR